MIHPMQGPIDNPLYGKWRVEWPPVTIGPTQKFEGEHTIISKNIKEANIFILDSF